MNVSISVVSDKTILVNKPLADAKAGKAIRVKAIKGGRYLLAEDGSGVAPENITVKRVGKNLHVALEGSDPDQPELIIEDFFGSAGELVGLGEDGIYHAYVAVDGDSDSEAAFLIDGMSSPLALGYPQLAGFGEGLVVGGIGMLPWALAGIGGLVGGAIVEHNRGGDDKAKDTTAPENNGIGSIIDDKGPHKGNIKPGDVTDDSRPTLGGSGQEPGDTVIVIDNGKEIGKVIVDGDGNWSFTPEKDLGDGEHVLEIIVKDPSGNSSDPSEGIVIIIDTTAPTKPGIESIIDDQGPVTGPIANGGHTDDTQPTLSGKGDAGDTVTIIDNGQVIGEVQVGKDGGWTFIPDKPLSEGEHVFEVVVTDPAGNSSQPSDKHVVVVDTTAPGKPSVGGVIDDHGPITGPVENGGITDDSKPTLTGKGDPGDTVTIIDNGNVIGEVVVDEGGNWTFTPEEALNEGEHVLEVVVTDPAGNSSEPSDEFVIIVDTTPPAKPGVESVVDDKGAVTGPVGNGGVTDDTQPTLSGKGDAGDTVTIIDNGNAIGEVVVGDDGTWTFTPEAPLSEGEHVFEVVVTDPAGNNSEPSDEYVVIVDTTPPANSGVGAIIDDQGTITGPVDNGGYTDDNKPTLTGKGDAGDTVTIIDNGKVIGEVEVGDDGTWAFTPEEALSEGEHSFEVVITDPAGNSSGPSDEFVIIVDTTPPAKPGIESIVDDQGAVTGPVGNGGLTDDTQPTLSGKGDAGDTITIIDNGKVIGEVQVGDNGTWAFTPEDALGEGEHIFEVVATDPAGNSSGPSDEYVIIIDSSVPSKPVIESVYDDQGDQKGNLTSGDVTDDSKPVFSGKADPNTTVIIKDAGVEIGRVPVGKDGKWTFEPSQPLPFGEHNITAEAVNSSGASSAPSDSFEFVLEMAGSPSAPAITSVIDDVGSITGNIQKNAVTDDARPTINGTAQVGTVVSVYIDGKLSGTAAVSANGEWSYTPSADLVDGLHNITAQATNAAGNVSPETGKYPINVDTVPAPKPDPGDAVLLDDEGKVTGAITDGMTTDDATPTFEGKGEPNGKVIIYDNDKWLGEAECDAAGNWSFTPSPALDDGSHSFNYEVVDEAGNVSPKSDAINFVVDTKDVVVRIDGATDDVGSVTGEIGKNGVTDDTTPTVHGKGTVGGTVKLFEGGVLLGEAVVDAEGKWSITPATPLAEGAHSLTATITTTVDGESEHSTAFDFSIDISAPTKPSIDSISDDVGSIQGKLLNGDDTDDTTPTLAGKAEAGSTVKIYDNGGLLGSAVADVNGNWGFTPTTPLNNGKHDFTVTAVDKAGNASVPSDVFGINIDTVAPAKPVILSAYDDEGDVTGILLSGAITDDAKPVFSGTAEANSTVVIKDKGVLLGTAQVGADGKWSFEPSTPLSKGVHGITAQAVDKAGNTSPLSDRFDLEVVSDVAPAEPAITSVIDDVGSITGNIQKNAVTDDARPTINGTAEAGMTVSVYIDGVLSGTTVVADNGEWSYTPTVDLVDGLHNITAKATNGVGNSSTETGKYPINVDTVPAPKPDPGDAVLLDDEGKVTGPITNGMTTDDATPTFEGKGEPNGMVIIYDNGKEIGRVPSDADGNWSFTPSPGLDDGAHSFDYEVVDEAGNVSPKSDAINFVVDTIDVVVSIDGATDDVGSVTGEIGKNGVTDDTTPTIHGKGTVGGTVKIYEGGVLLGEAVVGADGKWSITPATPLAEGPHSLNATITTTVDGEIAGAGTFDFSIDVSAPTKPSIDSISDDVGSIQGDLVNGDDTDDTTPTLAGKAEVGSTVKIYDNGSLLGIVVADGKGNWGFTPTTPLNNGKHDFTVIAVDKAGNASVPSDVFGINIDTVPPAKPVILSAFDDQGDVTGTLLSGAITDDAKPVFSGTAEANATVVIKDKGVLLGTAQVGADGKWSFEPSTPLSKGVHGITAQAVDKAGNTSPLSDRFDLEVVSDVAPAEPAITSVIDDVGSITGNIQKNAVTDDARPTINGTAEAGMTVSVYIDGVLSGTTVVADNGEWSYTPTVDLVDGLHNITAKATNGAGNSSTETGKYPITVDTVPAPKPDPGDAVLLDDEGKVTGPITNGMTTDDATPTFEGKGEPNGKVIIYDNDKWLGEAECDAAGNWSFTPSPALGDGNHSFNYQVVDQAGNVSPKSDAINFVVDTKDVVVSIDGATDDVGSVTGEIGKNGVTDDTTPTVHGKGTVGGTVKLFEGGVLLGEAVVNAEGKWSITPATPLAEGAHSLTATITTPVDGEIAGDGTFDFTIDLTPPSVPSIEAIDDDVGTQQGTLSPGQHTDDTTPTLSGKADAGSTVNIYDKGSLLGSVVADASGDWNFTPSPPLLNGEHDFTVTAKDKAGNESAPSDVFGIVIDTIPPAAPVIETVYDDKGAKTGNLALGDVTDDTIPTISGKAEANSTVIIKDRGVPIGSVVADADGKWTFEPATELAAGEHKLTAEAVDAAGNTSPVSNEFNFSVDNDIPTTPKITNIRDDVGRYMGILLNGGSTDDSTPTVNGNGKAGETIEIRMDGNVLGTAVVAENGRWSFTPSTPVVDGVHVFSAVSVSAGGAESDPSNSYQIRVDTVAPDAPIITRVHDNAGAWVGDLENGQITDDRTPTFFGKAEPNSSILVFNNGDEVGFASVDENGDWTYAAEFLAYGEHRFSFHSYDVAGNLSDASETWTVIVASATRGLDKAGDVDGLLSVQDLLLDGQEDMFNASVAEISEQDTSGISIDVSHEAMPQDSWAIRAGDLQGQSGWSGSHSIENASLLDQQLNG